MFANVRSSQLRLFLNLDALTCLACGVLFVAAAGFLAPLLGLSESLLRLAGAALFPTAALMLYAAARASHRVGLVRLIVAGNIAWVAGSILVLVFTNPTTLGVIFVLAQASVVALFAWLEGQAVPEPVAA
jgi:Na+/melibiose symporter-like transporter